MSSDENVVVPGFSSKDTEISIRSFEIAKISEWLKEKVLPVLKEKFPDQVEAVTGSLQEISLSMAIACEELEAAEGVIAKMGIIGSAIEDVSAEIEKISQLDPIPGAAKKEIVTLIIMESYELIDKGWDGTKNRVQFTKWIPVSISDVAERWILKIGVGIAIDAAVKAWHRYGGQ